MRSEAIQALQQFVNAAIYLQENWDEFIEEGYPFPQPFDEVVDDLLYWLVSVRLTKQNEME